MAFPWKNSADRSQFVSDEETHLPEEIEQTSISDPTYFFSFSNESLDEIAARVLYRKSIEGCLKCSPDVDTFWFDEDTDYQDIVFSLIKKPDYFIDSDEDKDSLYTEKLIWTTTSAKIFVIDAIDALDRVQEAIKKTKHEKITIIMNTWDIPRQESWPPNIEIFGLDTYTFRDEWDMAFKYWKAGKTPADFPNKFVFESDHVKEVTFIGPFSHIDFLMPNVELITIVNEHDEDGFYRQFAKSNNAVESFSVTWNNATKEFIKSSTKS